MIINFIHIPSGKKLKSINGGIIPSEDNTITLNNEVFAVYDVRINYDTDTCHVFVKSYVIDPVAKALWNDIINDKQPMDTRQQIVDILDHFTQCLGVDLDGSDVYGIHDNKLSELTEILVSILKQ